MGEFVFDHGWADAAERAGIRYYPKLLVGVPFTPHTGRRFLIAPGVDRAADDRGAGTRAYSTVARTTSFPRCMSTFCVADEAAALRELGFLERLGYQYHWRNTGFATFDDYLAHLKSKRRYAVRHERAALVAQGVDDQGSRGRRDP